jgi:hypothetical protein
VGLFFGTPPNLGKEERPDPYRQLRREAQGTLR